jgi:hypothetical protein
MEIFLEEMVRIFFVEKREEKRERKNGEQIEKLIIKMFSFWKISFRKN